MTLVSNDAHIVNINGLLTEAKNSAITHPKISAKFNDPDKKRQFYHFTCQWWWENEYPPYQGIVTVELTTTWENVSKDSKGIVCFRPSSVKILHTVDGKTEWIEAYLKPDSPIECTARPSNHLLWLLNRPWRWHAS